MGAQVLNGLGSDTRVLVSNVRDANTMARLAQMGLTTFSITPSLAEQMMDEPMSMETAKEIDSAARRGGATEPKDEPKVELKAEPEVELETEPEAELEAEPKAKPKR